MARVRNDLFEVEQGRMADWAKALAHPARIAILQLIAQRTTCVCGEIVDVLPLAQSTVSQHLSELKRAGLIKGEVEGPRVCYCLDHEAVQQVQEELGAFLDALLQNPPPECCP